MILPLRTLLLELVPHAFLASSNIISPFMIIIARSEFRIPPVYNTDILYLEYKLLACCINEKWLKLFFSTYRFQTPPLLATILRSLLAGVGGVTITWTCPFSCEQPKTAGCEGDTWIDNSESLGLDQPWVDE